MPRWIILILAVLAAGLSLYLTITVMLDSQPIGCGAGALDCEGVLSTRWSTWLGMPVAAAAVALYVTLAGAVLLSLQDPPPHAAMACQWLMAGLIGTILVASFWFLALQFVVLGKYCLYCLAIHGCGLAIGGIALVGMRFSLREVVAALTVGMLCGGVLVGGQVSSLNGQPAKDKYRVQLDPRLPFDEPIELVDSINPLVDGALLSLLNGQIRIAPASRPLVGNPNATVTMAKLFDYTCGHCRRQQLQLHELMQRHPDQYAVALIHIPLSDECNPYADPKGERHDTACDLSRLALAVWMANPPAFAPFDHWLCEPDKSRAVAAARAEAERLVGKEKLEAALAGGTVEEIIAENVEFYSLEQVPLLPTLFTKRRIISGSFHGANQMKRVLADESLKQAAPR